MDTKLACIIMASLWLGVGVLEGVVFKDVVMAAACLVCCQVWAVAGFIDKGEI